MALEGKASTPPITHETGLPTKGMVLSSESHLQAGGTPHTADRAPASAVGAILRSEAGHTPISLSIESPRVSVLPTNDRMKQFEEEVKRDPSSL